MFNIHSQKESAQMESLEIEFVSDFKMGDKLNKMNIMIIDDLNGL